MIQEDCSRTVLLLGGFAFELGDKSRSARLHMINWYALSRGRSLPDRALFVFRLGAPWEIFRGAIEAPITLGWIHLEELPCEYT